LFIFLSFFIDCNKRPAKNFATLNPKIVVVFVLDVAADVVVYVVIAKQHIAAN